jgi:glycosyltransferase involved in cell wall biosynthesis
LSASNTPHVQNVKPHVLIALENEPYPHDSRVRQEAQALVAAGYAVTVCSPTGFGFDALDEELEGVRVLRYPAPTGGRSVLGYAREYGISLMRLARIMRRAARTGHVNVVIVCCPPDLLVLPALNLRRRGAALIVDHHDLSPELFELKFGRRRILQALVRAAESYALGRADAVMATNDTYAILERGRAGVAPERIFVVRNGPDPARIFPVAPRPELRGGASRLVCWVGMMGEQDGLHHVLDAAEALVSRRDDVAFALVGSGDAREGLIADAARRGLDGVVKFPGRVDADELRAWMATADVCLSVDEPNPMNDASTMTKVVEYMAMGRPIVQFALRETSAVCGKASLYARPGDALHLAALIEEMLDDPQRADALGASARRQALSGLMWPDQVPALLAAVATAQRLRRDAA